MVSIWPDSLYTIIKWYFERYRFGIGICRRLTEKVGLANVRFKAVEADFQNIGYKKTRNSEKIGS